jgi:MinD superfamily P-loop ATPase
MIISIASGKGGTGKTTLAVNLAFALADHADEPVRLLDCDVEQPNDHLFVRPTGRMHTVVAAGKPDWNADACTHCGRCAEVCRYNALAALEQEIMIFPELCHACGACTHVCPTGAMGEARANVGAVETGRGAGFDFVRGTLNLGQVLTPLVIGAVRERVSEEAINIIDSAPGTACAAAAGIEGSDVAVLVTEPTPFGVHDLELAIDLCADLGVPAGIVVNRSDGRDETVEELADSTGAEIIGRLPYRRAWAECYARGGVIVQEHEEMRAELIRIYERARKLARTELAARATAPPLAPGGPPEPQAVSHRPDELVVLSGKGGTGKTTVAASLAHLVDDVAICDCDVDAADLNLLLPPEDTREEPFSGGVVAFIDETRCTGCGLCAQRCRFDAIRQEDGGVPRVVYAACEGCGLCELVCPAGAITMEQVLTGKVCRARCPAGPMAWGELHTGAENSGKLVARVRGAAAALADDHGMPRLLTDGPPGAGCPVIASMGGARATLIVTEPTVSGLHDLERVLELAGHFGVPAMVCINKSDLDESYCDRIGERAQEHGVPVVGRIPFDSEVHEILREGGILARDGSGPAARALRQMAPKLLATASTLGAP